PASRQWYRPWRGAPPPPFVGPSAPPEPSAAGTTPTGRGGRPARVKGDPARKRRALAVAPGAAGRGGGAGGGAAGGRRLWWDAAAGGPDDPVQLDVVSAAAVNPDSKARLRRIALFSPDPGRIVGTPLPAGWGRRYARKVPIGAAGPTSPGGRPPAALARVKGGRPRWRWSYRSTVARRWPTPSASSGWPSASSPPARQATTWWSSSPRWVTPPMS